MSQYAKIDDVICAPKFYEDYDKAPRAVQKRIDKLVSKIAEHGGFLPSMHVRDAYKSGYWMATITQNKQAWRLILTIEAGIIKLDRLMDHDTRDDYFRV